MNNGIFASSLPPSSRVVTGAVILTLRKLSRKYLLSLELRRYYDKAPLDQSKKIRVRGQICTFVNIFRQVHIDGTSNRDKVSLLPRAIHPSNNGLYTHLLMQISFDVKSNGLLFS